MISAVFDELIRQQFKVSLLVVDILRGDVLVSDALLLQEGQSKGKGFDQFFNVLCQEELVGVETALEELLESGFDVLEEEYLRFGFNFNRIFEGSRPQCEHAIALNPLMYFVGGNSRFPGAGEDGGVVALGIFDLYLRFGTLLAHDLTNILYSTRQYQAFRLS